MRLAIGLTLALAACNGNGLPGNGNTPDGGGGVPSDLGAACASAGDTASCEAIPGCKAVGCPTCDGGLNFFFCIPEGQPYGIDCSNPCELQDCGSFTDATACNARPDCFALFSGDLPCNNSSCTNHFVKCESAPPVCASSGGVCNGSCAQLTPSCRQGDAEVFPSASQTCCAIGCVTASKCPNATSCTSDAQCGAGAYCRGALASCRSMCQLTIGTASSGACHRSCLNDACVCTGDDDCPGAFTSCDPSTGKCKTLTPPICHAQCPTGCTDATDTQFGETCICTTCPPGP